MKSFLKLFTPFQPINGTRKTLILSIWLVFILSFWTLNSLGSTNMFPTPMQVLHGFGDLWKDGLAIHVVSSLALCFKAILYSVFFALIIAYSTTIPVFKPIGVFISKLRYLPLTGISFYLAIVINDGRSLQVWVLVVFMTTFLTTSLIQMVLDVPEEELVHARTLGCNRWETLWEVVIKGRLDYVFELVRQNLAIVWMMLVTVESILVAAGGLGFLIKNGNKLGDNGRVIATQIVIILLGIALDFLLTKTRKLIFRYSNY